MKLSKSCFKCGETKPLSAFYKHKQMKDGHVNKCVVCNKKDVLENRLKHIDRIRAYDRARGNRQGSQYVREYRDKYPNKYKAVTMVNNAVRDGKLHPELCVVCGTDSCVVAHHNDYLKPLNVVWMCQAHHKQWHAKNGEGLNG